MTGTTLFEIELCVDDDGIKCHGGIESLIQNIEKVLVKPGWSALRRVSFKVPMLCCSIVPQYSAGLSETLQSLLVLPDKYLSHFPKLKPIAFSLSSHIVH